MFLVKLLIAVVLVELFTELIVKSVIFRPVREKIKSINNWFAELFSCGYCMSVWVAFGIVFIIQPVYNLTGYQLLDLSLIAFLAHRLSNYLHNFNDKWLDKYYDVRFINSGPEDPEQD